MLRISHKRWIDDIHTDVVVELRKLECYRTSRGLERLVVQDLAIFAADGVTPMPGGGGRTWRSSWPSRTPS